MYGFFMESIKHFEESIQGCQSARAAIDELWKTPGNRTPRLADALRLIEMAQGKLEKEKNASLKPRKEKQNAKI